MMRITYKIDENARMQSHIVKIVLLAIASFWPIRAQSVDSNQEFIENKVKSAFTNGGITAVKDVISENLNSWREVRINIGVTGNSGVGKSSFINAIRGLTPEDDGAAAVGVVETTVTMADYQHPKNKNIYFWDLPGLGTPKFPKERYLEVINADKFDYFIIISADRFTENDMWLGKEMEKRRKAFYFVRTKVGQDIENNRKSHPKTHNKQSVLEIIRKDCKTKLHTIKSLGKPAGVYLIDNYDVNQYDFGRLSDQLIEDAPELKREAMIMSLQGFSENLIREKKKQLEGRIYKIAIISAAAGAAPIPFLDIAVDTAVILEEVLFYRSQFGLDEKTLSNYASLFRMTGDDFKTSLGLESNNFEFSKSGIINYLSKIGISSATSYLATNAVKYYIPFIGNIISGSSAYITATNCLNSILTMMVNDALKVNNHVHTESMKR